MPSAWGVLSSVFASPGEVCEARRADGGTTTVELRAIEGYHGTAAIWSFEPIKVNDRADDTTPLF